MRTMLHSVARALIFTGLILLAYPAAVFLGGRAYQAYQNRAFSDQPELSLDSPTPKPQTILGRLEIPRLKLSVMVLEGVNEPELLLGAGHVPGTALPGPTGNVGIAGHRDTYFRPLRNIRASDEIRLVTRDGEYRYLVESTKVTKPSDVAVLKPTPQGRLTLVTCYPFSYFGNAPDRFIVQARLVEPST